MTDPSDDQLDDTDHTDAPDQDVPVQLGDVVFIIFMLVFVAVLITLPQYT